MDDRRRSSGPVTADRGALLVAVTEMMQRFARADRDSAAGPPSNAGGVRCPSCEQASAARPSYLGLELCPHCGHAMPRRRDVVAAGGERRSLRP
jgi:hypothetical protein